jgi:hypothetical protein
MRKGVIAPVTVILFSLCELDDLPAYTFIKNNYLFYIVYGIFYSNCMSYRNMFQN